MTIVKVQLPLEVYGRDDAGVEHKPPALPLVYARGRMKVRMQSVPSDVKEACAIAGGKAFFSATWSDKGDCWIVGNQVKTEDW